MGGSTREKSWGGGLFSVCAREPTKKMGKMNILLVQGGIGGKKIFGGDGNLATKDGFVEGAQKCDKAGKKKGGGEEQYLQENFNSVRAIGPNRQKLCPDKRKKGIGKTLPFPSNKTGPEHAGYRMPISGTRARSCSSGSRNSQDPALLERK